MRGAGGSLKKTSRWFKKFRLPGNLSFPSSRVIKEWISSKLRLEKQSLPREPFPLNLTNESPMETMESGDILPSEPWIAENVALKQRMVELESYIHELKGRLDQWGLLPSKDPSIRTRASILLGVALLLTSIPPAFVVLDRWFANFFGVAQWVRRIWTLPEALSDIAVPAYLYPAGIVFLMAVIFIAVFPHERPDEFRPTLTKSIPQAEEVPVLSNRLRMVNRSLEIAVAFGYVTLLILGVTRNHVPGWGLILVILAYLASKGITEIPARRIKEFVHSHAYVIFSILLMQLSLIAVLASFYSTRRAIGVFTLLLLLSLINLYLHRQRISPMVWVFSLAVVLYTLKINSWLFSTIGDEYSFYFSARFIAEDQSLLEIGSNLFKGNEVYGSHPYFSSFLQAVSMWLLGSDNFGWRFSSIYLGALSIPFFYGFFKGFLSKRSALIMTLLLAVSQYLMNFGKIGYNNLQALTIMSIVLWAAGQAIRKRQSTVFFGLGMAIAACFYVYPVALYVLPLPVLLLLFYIPPFSRPSFRLWVYMVAGFMLLFLPLLFQQEYWQSKVAGTLFFTPEIVSSAQSLLYHFGSNLLYTWFSYVYIVEESHYVVSSYLDPVTAIFLPIGLSLTLRAVRKSRFAIFLFIAFILECFLVGATHDRRFPPTTRMFLLLPWFAIFSAMGIGWVVDQAQRISLQPIPASTLIGLLLVVILSVNLYQANVLYPNRTDGEPSLEVLFLRILQHDQRVDPDREKVYLFITEEDWGIDGLRTMQQVYKLPESQTQLIRVEVSSPDLPQWAISRIQEENTIVIIQPWMSLDIKKQIEATLVAMNKVDRDVRNRPTTVTRFTVWYSSQYEDLFEAVGGTW